MKNVVPNGVKRVLQQQQQQQKPQVQAQARKVPLEPVGGGMLMSAHVEPTARKTQVTPESSATETLVAKHAKRLGVDPTAAYTNLLEFAETVGQVESNGDLTALNVPQKGKEASSAAGKYQFVKGSIEPALNRLARTIGEQPWMASLRKHKDVTVLNDEQQTLMFLGEMLEKKGSDKYLKDIMATGDKEQMLQAYYKLHHTNPDEATKKRAVDYFMELEV